MHALLTYAPASAPLRDMAVLAHVLCVHAAPHSTRRAAFTCTEHRRLSKSIIISYNSSVHLSPHTPATGTFFFFAEPALVTNGSGHMALA